MKYNIFLQFLIVVFLFSCNSKQHSSIPTFFNESNIQTQLFSIDINRDTILVTNKGCIIKLPKGSLHSKINRVKLEIKEALSTTDMVLAGLTTMSGGQALSSGGMIYINAAEGYKVEIKKEVEILVPSTNYNPDMQVFKGEEKNNGSIDWTEPASLPKDETIIKINNGEALFKANCASCHKIDKDFTAPNLYGITERRPKQWLYAFTRNPMKLIQDGYYTEVPGQINMVDSSAEAIIPDFYSACLHHKWNNVVMTAFPMLSDTALDAIYSYIKTESDKLPELKGTGENCCDSCDTWGKALYAASKQLRRYKEEVETFFTLDRTIPVPMPFTNDTIIPSSNTTTWPSDILGDLPTVVAPKTAKATYYTINIKAFGWYNIDILMKDFSKCTPSELFVRIQGSYEVDLNVVLIIPSVKAFVEGGKLKDGKQYGFDETDGKIPLPMGAQCYVMAFGEYNEKIIFGKTTFTAQQTQTIDVKLTETTKESIKLQVKEMNLDDVSIDIKNIQPTTKKADNAKKAKKIDFDKQIEEAMKLKPVNCKCALEQ